MLNERQYQHVCAAPYKRRVCTYENMNQYHIFNVLWYSSVPACWQEIKKHRIQPNTAMSSRGKLQYHYDDVIMGAIASLITSFTIVYSTVYSDPDQRKHQSSASLAFVWGIHRGPVNSPHKWPVTRKMFPFDDVIMTVFRSWPPVTLILYLFICEKGYACAEFSTLWTVTLKIKRNWFVIETALFASGHRD